MIGGDYDEAVEWCDRVLAAVGVATELQLLEATDHQGNGTLRVGQSPRGRDPAARCYPDGRPDGCSVDAALRARNNLLGSLERLRSTRCS